MTDAASGAPIAGASIETAPPSKNATAASDGRFTLPDIMIGVYQVKVTATGYTPDTIDDVSVIAGGLQSVSVAMVAGDGTGAVMGRVKDRANANVADAKVTLIDSAQVAASAKTVEEPLAELAPTSPYSATTATDGRFSIQGVAPGRYYVYIAPVNSKWLPGGERATGGGARASVQIAAGATDLGDFTVSQQPSAAATFIGSSRCLQCHPNTRGYTQSLHALTYRVPPSEAAQLTANQDLSLYPNHDRALVYFEDGNANDNTGAGDAYGYRLTNISANYNVLIGRESDGERRYFAVFQTKDGTITSLRYYVAFTFGGEGVYKERFITRVDDGLFVPAGQGSYYILPIQFDEVVQDSAAILGANAVNPWIAYNAANWPTAPTADGGPTGTPARNKSFDLNCSGCHFTGTGLTVDAKGNFQAHAVPDVNGVLDYDGDGLKEEISQGCEVCHGPGSEHAAQIGQGPIIQPSLLSGELATNICGQCHIRGAGKGTVSGEHTEFPSKGTDVAISFPRAGVSRAVMKAEYHTDKPGNWPDGDGHAKQHHQQYYDHIKSAHYRNPFDLLACDDCHNPHDNTNLKLLIGKVQDNSTCLNCHASFPPFSLPQNYSTEQEGDVVSAHMIDYAGMASIYDPANILGSVDVLAMGYNPVTVPFIGGPGNCVSCHMATTPKSQAQWSKTGGKIGTIIRGDITSHQFDIVWPSTSAAMKIKNIQAGKPNDDVIPNACGSCHNELTGITPTLVP